MYSPFTLTTTSASSVGDDAVFHEPQLGAESQILILPKYVRPTKRVPEAVEEIDTWVSTSPPGREIVTHVGVLGMMLLVYLMVFVSTSRATTLEPLIAACIALTPVFLLQEHEGGLGQRYTDPDGRVPRT